MGQNCRRRMQVRNTGNIEVYLAGEIHSAWREELEAACRGLEVVFTAPVTDHEASDDCGVAILGPESETFWHDHKGAKLNAIRTRSLIDSADLVVVRFGEKYRQWNAAFDAGQAVALGTPIITLHPPEHDHALKEINAAAQATCRDTQQVADVLRYVLEGSLGGS